MLLEKFGCKSITASDHRSALRAASENTVDLAVIDYHLANGETGEQIALDLRVMSPRLPLIMLTGDSRLPASASDSVDAVLIKGASNATALLDLIERLLPDAELVARRPMLIKNRQDNSDKSGARENPEKAS